MQWCTISWWFHYPQRIKIDLAMWRLQFPGYWFSSNSPTLHGILSNIRNAHYISCVSGSHWVDTRVIQSNYNNQLRVGSTMECVDEERLRVFIHSMFAFAFSHHSQLYHCEKQKRRQLSFQSVFVFTHNLLSQLLVDFRGQGHPEVNRGPHGPPYSYCSSGPGGFTGSWRGECMGS